MVYRAVQGSRWPRAAASRVRCATAARTVLVRVHSTSSHPAAAVYPPLVFPHSDQHALDNNTYVSSSTIIDLLSASYTEERLQRLQQVVAARCYGVVPVVEGLYDMGNFAAVCRSADALGFGAVHCIMSQQDKYKKSQRAAAGADKWLDVKLWDNTPQCIHGLKAAGYKVLVTHLGSHSVTLQDWDWTQPTAFVLGNEKSGVSQEAVQLADATMVVPMTGFVESFNISVAAALIMYEAQQQLQRRLQRPGDLGPQQQQHLMAEFLLRGLRNSKLVAQQLLERPPPHHQRRHFKKPPATTEAAAAAAAGGGGSEGNVEGGTGGLAPDASSRLELLRQKYGKKSTDTGATGFAAWQQQQQQLAGWREEGEACSVVHADSSPRDPARAA